MSTHHLLESDDYWNVVIRSRLDTKFDLRPSNWRRFPGNLKKQVFRVFTFGSSELDGRYYLFHRLRQMTGLEVTDSLSRLLLSYPKIYEQVCADDDEL